LNLIAAGFSSLKCIICNREVNSLSLLIKLDY